MEALLASLPLDPAAWLAAGGTSAGLEHHRVLAQYVAALLAVQAHRGELGMLAPGLAAAAAAAGDPLMERQAGAHRVAEMNAQVVPFAPAAAASDPASDCASSAGSSHSVSLSLPTCSVCLDPLEPQASVVYFVPCAHVFHAKCLSEWLAAKATCPVCRARWMSEPDDQSSHGPSHPAFTAGPMFAAWPGPRGAPASHGDGDTEIMGDLGPVRARRANTTLPRNNSNNNSGSSVSSRGVVRVPDIATVPAPTAHAVPRSPLLQRTGAMQDMDTIVTTNPLADLEGVGRSSTSGHRSDRQNQ
jgi:hypothetical protein